MEALEFMLWRRRHRLKQSELAKFLHLSRVMVSHYETGTYKIPGDMEFRLSALAESKAAEPPPPEWVDEHCCSHLYDRMKGNKGWLVYERLNHPSKLLNVRGPIPYAVLDSLQYKTELAKYNADTRLWEKTLRTRNFRDQLGQWTHTGRLMSDEEYAASATKV